MEVTLTTRSHTEFDKEIARIMAIFVVLKFSLFASFIVAWLVLAAMTWFGIQVQSTESYVLSASIAFCALVAWMTRRWTIPAIGRWYLSIYTGVRDFVVFR